MVSTSACLSDETLKRRWSLLSGAFEHYAQNYIISKYDSICCIRNYPEIVTYAMIECVFEFDLK